MGIIVRIPQGKKAKIDIYDIEKFWQNTCTNVFKTAKVEPRLGTKDEFFRMNYEFTVDIKRYRVALKSELMRVNEYTLFDVNNFGSGINFFIDNENQIEMWTSFPTTYSELVSFYKLVNIICQKLKITEFQRGSKGEFETVKIEQLDWFVELGINDTLIMLMNIKSKLEENKNDFISINGVNNPISLGLDSFKNFELDLPLENNIDNINKVMYNYEKHINDMQKDDLYYGVFKLYQMNRNGVQTIDGFMAIKTECNTIIPKEPNTEFYFGVNKFDTRNINKFYVILEDSKGETHYVEYTKFIERIDYDSQKKYDATHVIIVLSKEKNDEICGIL